MIIWIASYPKSGNTWIRTVISQLIFDQKTSDHNWLLNLHKKIDTYPKLKHFNNINPSTKNKNIYTKDETIMNWIVSQKIINRNKNPKFFKTHNMYCSIEVDNKKYNFTDLDNTLGVIHIVRDPRNIITSLKNHFFFKSYNEALNMFLDKRSWVGVLENEIPQALGSWEDHYKSWSLFPKNYILFKYEEILSNPKKQIKRLIKYLEKFALIKYDEEKIDDIIHKTSFENLRTLENKGFFLEKPVNNTTKETTNFFFLGPKNDFRKILDEKTIYAIEKKFKKTMQELGYL